jgi:hypothetical protein
VSDAIRELERELLQLERSTSNSSVASTPSVKERSHAENSRTSPHLANSRLARHEHDQTVRQLSTSYRNLPNARQPSPPTSVQYVGGGDGSGITMNHLGVTRSNRPTRPTPLALAPEPQVPPSCPACQPSDPPDENKDFIISARTGETRGRKRFGLHDNARIIVVEKNPFLYEYRVTLKDKPILEPAIAQFFGNFSLFVDRLDQPQAASGGAAAFAGGGPSLRDFMSDNCPQLSARVDVADLESLLRSLAAADASADAGSLRNQYIAAKSAYEGIAQQVDNAKRVLYDQNASCPNLCDTANRIHSTLQAYNPNLQQLSQAIDRFKSQAERFQREVQILEEEAARSNPIPAKVCRDLIDELRRLALGYAKTAEDLEAGVQKIVNGKKTFDAIVKTINNVLSNQNAFYQVYTRGQYNLPTDVEITVERRDLTKGDSTFAKVVEGETVNFGGGARFAVAGGVVVSPLETVNFTRVPALINGRKTTIVGRDEGSSTRILPMLMLHGRVAEGGGAVSGLHMSIGITAKPDDSGTNVEFLIGPSISFIEERLFLTFGGYAGRRKHLEGNLALGQELPQEFSDDIPTSTHLIWKPGIALTYKFK